MQMRLAFQRGDDGPPRTSLIVDEALSVGDV
jgi:hypothetical protein